MYQKLSRLLCDACAAPFVGPHGGHAVLNKTQLMKEAVEMQMLVLETFEGDAFFCNIKCLGQWTVDRLEKDDFRAWFDRKNSDEREQGSQCPSIVSSAGWARPPMAAGGPR